MSYRGSLLLVSRNPELHRILEIITTSYSLELIAEEGVKQGLAFLKIAEPDCVIFDLGGIKDMRQRDLLKEKLEAKEIPILFLNDRESDSRRPSDLLPPLRIEPIAKFIVQQHERIRKCAKRGFLRRMFTPLYAGRG